MTTLRSWIAPAIAGAVMLAPGAAFARCMEGAASACVGRNNCPGTRECLSGHFSGCMCNQDPPCVICGRQSTQNPNGTCKPLPEMCNACDDDLDGQIDEGLSGCLASGPFSPKCTATTVPVSSAVPAISLDLSSMGRLPANPVTFEYANNMIYTARIHTNALVNQFKVRQASPGVDPFDTYQARVRATNQVFNQNASILFESPLPLNGTGQTSGIDLEFVSNRTVGGIGWWADQVSVTCSAATGTAPSVAQIPVLDENNVDTYATLTDSDDVVFFQIPMTTDPITVWMEPTNFSTGLEADLYVKFDTVPLRNSFNFSSKRAGSNEMVAIDSPLNGRTAFIAVHSRSGRGTVNLRFARSIRAQLYSSNMSGSAPLRVGFSFAATPTDKASARATLGFAQQYVLGLTEGKAQLRNIELYENDTICSCAGQTCHVCLRGESGRSYAATTIALFGNVWNRPGAVAQMAGGRTLGHEVGHLLFGLPDEYRDHGLFFDIGCSLHSDTTCTASAMGRQSDNGNLCNTFDHGREGEPVGHTCATCPVLGQSCAITSCNACFAGAPSAWERMVSNGKVRTRPTMTPNASQYMSFPLPTNVFGIATR